MIVGGGKGSNKIEQNWGEGREIFQIVNWGGGERKTNKLTGIKLFKNHFNRRIVLVVFAWK